jgi:hypothetical protein
MRMKIHYPAIVRLIILCIVLLVSYHVSGYSQDVGSCAEKLKTAQSLFEKGQVGQVPSILRECMKSGFTREESLTAYKLLIQAYLFEDKLEKADSTMMAFLKKNPEYQLSPTDHSSFVHLYNNFVVKPVVQIAFHIGTNIPFITFIDPKSTAPIPGKNIYNTEALNFFGSVEAKFKIGKKLNLNFEPGYSQLAFTNIENFTNNEGKMDIGITTYTETQKRLELPVSVTYDFKSFGKFTPYVRLGAGPALTLGSSANTVYDDLALNGTDRTGPDIDRKDSRISMDLFTQTGAGIKFKTRGGFIIAEVRSNIGILNQTVRGGDPFWEGELSRYYFYVDDDFHINTLNITLGYTQIFYKPSKRKE